MDVALCWTISRKMFKVLAAEIVNPQPQPQPDSSRTHGTCCSLSLAVARALLRTRLRCPCYSRYTTPAPVRGSDSAAHAEMGTLPLVSLYLWRLQCQWLEERRCNAEVAICGIQKGHLDLGKSELSCQVSGAEINDISMGGSHGIPSQSQVNPAIQC